MESNLSWRSTIVNVRNWWINFCVFQISWSANSWGPTRMGWWPQFPPARNSPGHWVSLSGGQSVSRFSLVKNILFLNMIGWKQSLIRSERLNTICFQIWLVESRAGHLRYFWICSISNNKKLFFTFFIKLIWLGVGFFNRTGARNRLLAW